MEKHKQTTYVIQFYWRDHAWIDCTKDVFTDKAAAFSRLVMLRSERLGITYRLIQRTEEEIA